MNILIIGSGARECSIVHKLKKDNNRCNILCFGTNKNPYLLNLTNFYLVNDYSLNTIINQSNLINIDFVIIGPEIALKNKISDYFENNGVSCLGPLSEYAKIETSKIYCRQFLEDNNLGNYSPRHSIITSNSVNIQESPREYVNDILNLYNDVVYKKDGLHGGKGVLVQNIDFTDKHYLTDLILNEINSEPILIEEKLEGEEFSLMTIADGYNNVRHFPPIQDYKRLDNNDLGPNTGSMGCVIDKDNMLPFLEDDDILTCRIINKNVIKKLSENSDNYLGYRGILYGSFIKTKDGEIYIIEFNARFGDPEGILALNLLESNFYDMCYQIKNKKLETNLVFKKESSIGVYIVPKNYPRNTSDKYDIYIDYNKVNMNNIIYGNVEIDRGHLYSLSSRSIFYFQEGKDLYTCYNKIYSDIKGIVGNLKYRSDIGSKFLSEYEKAGVSIENGDLAVRQIKTYIERTYNDNVIGKHGDFGGQIRLNDNTILVSSIDGVGTKTITAKKYRGCESFINLGKDIVNHCVNDILVQGAMPLFFMDYYGTANLNVNELKNFIDGVSQACLENNNLVLLGGETAEMSKVYKAEETDLVGCIVGVKNELFLKQPIKKGDVLIGLESNGPHTNGFSLVNTIENIPNHIINQLLNPHKSYLSDVNNFVSQFGYDCIHGMCHITGGGLVANLKRIIPDNLNMNICLSHEFPEWTRFIKTSKNMSDNELLKVYNCGIGFVLIIDLETYQNNKINEIIKYKFLGNLDS